MSFLQEMFGRGWPPTILASPQPLRTKLSELLKNVMNQVWSSEFNSTSNFSCS